MKTKKELEKELENCTYRMKSLSDISNRREMEEHEIEELELLEIRCKDIKEVLDKRSAAFNAKFVSAGKIITLFAAVFFLLLTVYSSTSAYHFLQSEASTEKQIIMAVTTLLTFLLTIGAGYALKKQFRLEWR
ncbi:hypothetical protein QQ008_10320 [Fulvivirgaceae bacterium BMA10]|uniref:Uncharacterized protein n=1 Tax=Splendidivirga corallicola TaxID=3051826 RepID=A0ABT8KM19_9BACT|nr:hypothetical protein [Fulvivirgaceae bacterium BMA10]